MPKLYQRKKDTGIIPELGLLEETRDRLAKRDWSKPAKRPEDHPDNWTTADCERKKFSGLRVNKLNGMTEIWAAGRKVAEEKTIIVGNDPEKLATLLEEAFMTCGTIIATDIRKKRVILNPRKK